MCIYRVDHYVVSEAPIQDEKRFLLHMIFLHIYL